jgi:hypothetical protein
MNGKLLPNWFGAEMLFVSPKSYVDGNEVTVDYYLAGIDSPSASHWIVPGTGYGCDWHEHPEFRVKYSDNEITVSYSYYKIGVGNSPSGSELIIPNVQEVRRSKPKPSKGTAS